MLGWEWAVILVLAFYGVNVATFAFLTMIFEAKRCSGDVNTAEGNTFTNKTVIWTILVELGFRLKVKGGGEVDFMVEGDDGIIGSNVPLRLDPSLWSRYGLIVKIDEVSHYYLSSFCGMVFDPESMTILTNPIKTLLNFGWASGQYANANRQTRLSLLRAKALSFGYLYPQCPMVTSLVRRALQLTRGVRVRACHWKTVAKYGVKIPTDETKLLRRISEPTYMSRVIVNKLWKITIEDQISIEEQLSCVTLGKWSIPEFSLYIPNVAKHFIGNYLSYDEIRLPVYTIPNQENLIDLLNHLIANKMDTRPAYNPLFWKAVGSQFSVHTALPLLQCFA
jgi:hypothetical protein